MLAENKLILLNDLVSKYSRDEIIWASGYLAGLTARPEENGKINQVSDIVLKPTIIYGTETGNSKKLALSLQAVFKKKNIRSKVWDAFQYPVDKIANESLLIVIMSTQGEGDPPQNAIKFFDNLSNTTADISKTRFAVLGLGDSSYPLYCKAGEVIDQQLERLKGERILPYQKADVDYQPVAEQWFDSLIDKILSGANQSGQTQVQAKPAVGQGKKNYTGKIKTKILLNDIGSNKETHHIEIESRDEIVYEPGDAVGFYPQNSEAEIEEIVGFFNNVSENERLKKLNIKGLSKKSLKELSALLSIEIQEEKADLIDVLHQYKPEKTDFEDLLKILNPIAPRLYSISSSPEAHDGEVHITVTQDTFKHKDALKKGFCSSFLAGFEESGEIEFYIHKNRNFKLPEDDRDIILIGPGTGVAPFRGFIAHRDATGAEGRNWLFFGEQHFVSDFYYQTEIQEWLSTGVLTKLDTAFSRDQKEKIYVQDRLKEQAAEVAEWLNNGAYLYICGQKEPMSKDVENTLIDILIDKNNWNQDKAKAFLEELEIEGRYQKDVY